VISPKRNGFTLIELVIVILMLGILSFFAIPNFIEFRTEAKNGATQGLLGAFRSALAIAVSAIQVKEDHGVPRYPTFNEMSANAFDSSHPVLSGTEILDKATDIPNNPWSKSTAARTDKNRIYDCSALAKGGLLSPPNNDQGWCYNENTGMFWTNSDRNSGLPGETENYY